MVSSLDPPWLRMRPLRAVVGEADFYVLLSDDEGPVARLDFLRPDEYCFRLQAFVWGKLLLVGYGHRVYVHPIVEHDLGSYFIDFVEAGDELLITSGERILCLDRNGRARWVSPPLGLDGVLIDEVTDDAISGQGEWDPPGGWRPFRLCRDTGAIL